MTNSCYISRLFWLFAISIGFFLTGQLIFEFLNNTKKLPFAIYIEEKRVHVSDLHFPAVTFCPGLILSEDRFTKLDYDKIFHDLATKKLSFQNLTDNE